MDIDGIIAALVRELEDVPGVAGIVLGGSRARGTHTVGSDIDLALYYRPAQPLDLAHLSRLATAVDDAHRADVITGIGGWGPWINGGGWLTVRTLPVDLLYRDFAQVRTVLEECIAGHPRIVYQPGHPHGFVTAIYLAEIALCRVLWDPSGAIAELKRLATPYPPALKTSLIRMFFWEADFSLKTAAKALARADVSYIAGCCFRTVSCLLQTLFALNETYWMNEKGAVAIAARFPLAPPRLHDRIDQAFALLIPVATDLERALANLEGLVVETAALLARAGFST